MEIKELIKEAIEYRKEELKINVEDFRELTESPILAKYFECYDDKKIIYEVILDIGLEELEVYAFVDISDKEMKNGDESFRMRLKKVFVEYMVWGEPRRLMIIKDDEFNKKYR